MQPHCKNVTLDYLRLPILDCNGELLCSQITESYIAVKPSYDVFPVLRELLDEESFKTAAQKIAGGFPVYARVKSGTEINNMNMITLKKYVRYENNDTLVHLTGYVDAPGNGVTGIEQAFDSYLKTDIPLYAGFACDANGKIIDGEAIRTDRSYYENKGGIKLTVDKNIQEITENALENSDIKKGAALICETKTGAIRAMASVPGYDRSNVEESLDSADSPLLNRALSAYPAGSVFKVVTAAAAIENGVSPDFTIKCTGSVTVDGKVFHCNNSTAHGQTDMRQALIKSCNCYFIKLAQMTGYRPILETSGILGYGRTCEIAEKLLSSSGSIPSADGLKSSGQLALFSFGQGSLTANTIQIANTFSAVANGGMYTEPFSVESVSDSQGNEAYSFTPKPPVRAFSAETADILKSMLTDVVAKGTAEKAQTTDFDSAGKTATAQTGIFNPDRTEKLCTWFGGFFPAENPEYTVVIIKEDGTTGGEDCAPVFKEIAEKIYSLK